jgi:hypothetical protein
MLEEAPIISIEDFANALASYFDYEEGMRARDQAVSSMLSEGLEMFYWMLDDLPNFAALLSGCLGITVHISADEFDGKELGEEHEALASYLEVDESHSSADVLGTMMEDERFTVALAVAAIYLASAPALERAAHSSVSYELYTAGGRSV